MRFKFALCGFAGAVWLAGCALFPASTSRDWSARVGEQLQGQIGSSGESPLIRVAGKAVGASPWLAAFYLRRGNRPVWSSAHGPLARADELVEVLQGAALDGLRPEDYHLPAIEGIVDEWRRAGTRGRTQARLVELDLLLTNAFLLYAAHLQGGRVRPWEIHEEWQAPSPAVDLAGLLQTALDLNHVGQMLESLRPSQSGYTRLRQALRRYRQIAAQGGWPQVVRGGQWRLGHRSAEVETLQRRLLASGDLEMGMVAERALFDRELERALRRFQSRHGLEESGQVDEATLAALSVPVEERIFQIELNMERWRWLPHHSGTRYILVRIADFELNVVEDGESVMNMRVIVGKPYWRTPIFSSTMAYLVFNPYWYIPQRIVVDEILPLVRRDPAYLERKEIRVLAGQGDSARVVLTGSMDWSGFSAENFDYGFMQVPGPQNPLGRVKFAFPNSFNVYLHDTPNQALFARPRRAFSHGCIRLEKSLELAAYVLEGKSGWNGARVEAAVESGQNQKVYLPEPVPVYLLYWTAWVAESGEAQFRRDLYDSDQRLREALHGWTFANSNTQAVGSLKF